MFDFLKSNKIFDVRLSDGSTKEVTAKSESQAAELGQQMFGQAATRVWFKRDMLEPANDFERLHSYPSHFG